MHDLAVIVPAGGTSSRFGGEKNKLQELLAGTTVLQRSVDAFRSRLDVECIIVAGNLWQEKNNPANTARIETCPGGPHRAQSVWNALKCIPTAVEWVAVHDAARPLISQTLIDRTLAAARKYGAAAPAMPVALTVKEIQGEHLPARVARTVPRDKLWSMQTPQIMRRSDLLQAFEQCPNPLAQITDDVQLLELAGKEVWLVEGEERNLKITTKSDLRIAEMWL
ncbi:MAG TPA: 2-C-methyl-D-erythritol 4-phosphate cytidylyltransferase [Tepidisphaeraceae bacterium]|jgi:2-C-methyl-D-erythritol 4-phosphate cytidylyltransferase|nr:2-C-methyl-D-erythritol 4-phosphate cytidylyltransferase [Tepidisphaeraceae bacterium]